MEGGNDSENSDQEDERIYEKSSKLVAFNEPPKKKKQEPTLEELHRIALRVILNEQQNQNQNPNPVAQPFAQAPAEQDPQPRGAEVEAEAAQEGDIPSQQQDAHKNIQTLQNDSHVEIDDNQILQQQENAQILEIEEKKEDGGEAQNLSELRNIERGQIRFEDRNAGMSDENPDYLANPQIRLKRGRSSGDPNDEIKLELGQLSNLCADGASDEIIQDQISKIQEISSSFYGPLKLASLQDLIKATLTFWKNLSTQNLQAQNIFEMFMDLEEASTSLTELL